MGKPTFESSIRTFTVDGQVYNEDPVEGNICDLRRDNKGVYRLGTYGHQLLLYFWVLFNQREPGAKKVIEAASLPNGLFGDTALYGGDESSDEYIFAQDHPLIKNDGIVMAQKALESKLGNHQKGQVIFGSHGVRAIPIKAAYEGEFTSRQIKKVADYIVFLTGREKAPEEVAQTLREIKREGYTSVPAIGEITVPGLDVGDGRLYLVGNGWSGFRGGRRSFRVRR